MEIVLNSDIPGLTLKSSMMFAYPTSMMNVWDPAIEQILLPEVSAPLGQVQVKVLTGNTGARSIGSWKWKMYRLASGLLKTNKTLDYSGKFIFDARFDTDKNPSHILDKIATPILYVRKALSEHFQQDIEINVVLNANTSTLAKRSYPLLGIPIISTDDDVFGEVVTVFSNSQHSFCGVRPALFDIDFLDHPNISSEKIFIPRRGNRSLLNNDEVTAFLTERGFKTCYFEDFSVNEQWSIARNAKVVVAVHGAAVTHLIFNRLGLRADSALGSGVKVVEIMSPGWIHDGFRRLVNEINGRWCSTRGQITPEVLRATDFSQSPPNCHQSPFKDPFKVDCKTIQMALNYLDEDG